MKNLKKTKILNLEEQFYKKLLPARGNMEPINQFHVQKDGTELIPSYPVLVENIYSWQNRVIFKGI